jgi:hypothetical protein
MSERITREQALAMDAGPELDALIAEMRGETWLVEVGPIVRSQWIAGAWPLMEDLPEGALVGKTLPGMFEPYHVAIPTGSTQHAPYCVYYYENTAPLAICRAWLAYSETARKWFEKNL